MAITSEYSDTVEPIADVDAEAATNQHLYGVISGCGVTYDAANMTYDVAAGKILHNGIPVTVAAQVNAGTLVADGSNPRWATIYLDSTGVEGLVSGTAAADPSKPETGDNVAIAMVLIEAGQTIANNISVKLDKRVFTHPQSVYVYKSANETVSNSTTLQNDDTLTFDYTAGTYDVELCLLVSEANTAANGHKFAFTFTNATVYALSEQGVPDLTDTGYNASSYGTSGASASITTGTAFTTYLDPGPVGSAGVPAFFKLRLIVIATGSGTLQYQWAQQVASVSNSILHAGSFLRYTKIA